MTLADLLLQPDVAVKLLRARVVSTSADGTVVIEHDQVSGTASCDVLHTAESSTLQLVPGDTVLAWHPGGQGDIGVVLGRIGRSTPAATEPETPNELVLEAKHSLTLRVGSGSITIREDGKILIKGKDLVSHAQRLNRIKGGAVQIN